MSFNQLSNELILEIFRKVDDKSMMEIFEVFELPLNLAALSQCCRRFYELAQPLLYSEFNPSHSGIQNVAAFFRTILSKPHLARYVKDFRATLNWGSELETNLSFVTLEERAWIRKFWMPDCDFGKHYCDAWHQRLFSSHNWDAVAALLLRVFSGSLESLDLWFSRDPTDSDVMRVVEVLSKDSSPIAKLRSVSVSHSPIAENPRAIPGIKHVLPFLKIKSVKKFLGRDIQDIGWANWTHTNCVDTTDLHLLQCTLVDGSLRDFLRCFYSLKTFKLEDYRVMPALFHPSAIGQGLSHLKHCLEDLYIDDDSAESNWTSLIVTPISLSSALGSLSDFKNLKSLAVDAYILLGSEHTDDAVDDGFQGGQLKWYYNADQVSAFANALPPSLEFLHIRKCSPAIFECITQLFHHGGAPVSLKAVHLHFRRGSPIEPYVGDVSLWDQAAFASGIEFGRWTTEY